MKISAQDIAYLRDRAKASGYNADDILKVMNYESSGRPDVWGGKGGKYFGLLQFGPEERKQFGVDTEHPNAQNQIDAGLKYLDARGFRPGMGLMDLYSTVLAGSPGHYNRTDGAGTVAEHVGKMSGNQPSAPMEIAPAINTPSEKTDEIGSLIASDYDVEKMRQKKQDEEIGKLGLGLLSQSSLPGKIIASAPMMQPMQFNAPIPQPKFSRQNVRGLLSRG